MPGVSADRLARVSAAVPGRALLCPVVLSLPCPTLLCSAWVQGLLCCAQGSNENFVSQLSQHGRSSAASATPAGTSCRSVQEQGPCWDRHIPWDGSGEQRSQPSVGTTEVHVEPCEPAGIPV